MANPFPLTATRLAACRLEMRDVLAGAYRGRDIGERELLTHAVAIDDARGVERSVCRVPLEHLADYAARSEPTCPQCLKVFQRWQALKAKEVR